MEQRGGKEERREPNEYSCYFRAGRESTDPAQSPRKWRLRESSNLLKVTQLSVGLRKER